MFSKFNFRVTVIDKQILINKILYFLKAGILK